MSRNKKRAILLLNLGTPDEPTPRAVSRFLKKFLSDSRVVEAPKILWWFILRCFVIPLRSKRVAQAYQEIWQENGSPLRIISTSQAEKLQQLFAQRLHDRAPLVISVETYGEPSLRERIEALSRQGVESFIVLPLYPQYSGSTTGAIYDQVAKVFLSSRNVPDLRVIKSYYDHPRYIACLAEAVINHWRANGRNQRLLMSFHGVPVAYVEKGDPYYAHCKATAVALAQRLNLAEGEWAFSFQSRFGPKKWLQPFTDEVLQKWAQSGVESVDVISPAFTVDCLETLEELNVVGRNLFLSSGGKNFAYVPCLNDSASFIEFLAELSL